jgi:hypothetical protein
MSLRGSFQPKKASNGATPAVASSRARQGMAAAAGTAAGTVTSKGQQQQQLAVRRASQDDVPALEQLRSKHGFQQQDVVRSSFGTSSIEQRIQAHMYVRQQQQTATNPQRTCKNNGNLCMCSHSTLWIKLVCMCVCSLRVFQ